MSRLISLDDYKDPLTLEIMADPVSCDDGHTYDRPVIEHWFDERIKSERARQDEQERRAGGDRPNDDSTCCGARPPINLTSPMSGEVVSNQLVPNRALEKQIVRLIESQTGKDLLSAEEIENWNQRREEKKHRHRERLEAQRRDREEDERRRRNAEEAIRRREAEQREAVASSNGQVRNDHNATQWRVRIDRSTAHNKLCKDDLGLSLDLCDEDEQIPPGLIDGDQIRCMIACCAKDLEGNLQWCARCGRLVCSTCLRFSVTNIQEAQPSITHQICFDCVVHVVDSIHPTDLRARRIQLVLRKVHVERHLKELTRCACEQQDVVVRQETLKEYKARIKEVEKEVVSLKQRLADLRVNIESAHEAAERARQDTGMTANPQSLELRSTELQHELETLRRQGPPEDEDAMEEYFQRLTDLGNELESTQLEYVTATMAVPQQSPQSNAKTNSCRKQALTIQELEEKCSHLELRRNKVLTMTDAFSRVMQLSAIDAELDEAQMNLVMALSSESNPQEHEDKLDEFDVSAERATIEALGRYIDNDWPLPLGLTYPTPKMELQYETFRNEMASRTIESQRKWEEHFVRVQDRVAKKRDEVEEQISAAESELEAAREMARQEQADMEERRRLAEERRRQEEQRRERVRREREERRRREEAARQQKERARQERERRARKEAEDLRARRNAEEAATQRAFASAGTSASAFGGSGTLRMCHRCRAGPFENMACNNLNMHNDSISRGRKANHCPNCNWFSGDWNQWPLWDGIHGPH